MKRNRTKIEFCWIIGILFLATLLTLASGWEIGGESWGYWFFSRVFEETGRFVIPDRSPLYTLYVGLFRWVPYPYSTIAEYIVTLLFTSTCLFFLIRFYLGPYLAGFAALLWIPFLQTTEPYVQMLSLGVSCLALALRKLDTQNKRLSLFYALLGVASLLRMTYILMLFIFAVWDFLQLFFKKRKLSSLIQVFTPNRGMIPIFIIILMSIWFRVAQSNHSSNNAWFISNRWFPVQGKSLVEASMIQTINWNYILETYKQFDDHDFYFTHPEIFGDNARDLKSSLMANPNLVVRYIRESVKNVAPYTFAITSFHSSYQKFVSNHDFLYWVLYFSLIVPAFFLVRKQDGKDMSMTLFMVGNLILIWSTVLTMPQPRYNPPMIPIFALSGFALAKYFGYLLAKKLKKYTSSFIYVLAFGFIYSFSSGYLWGYTAEKIRQKFFATTEDRTKNRNEYAVMARALVMKVAQPKLKELVTHCKGILTLEHAFLGAFTQVPLSALYDIFDLPPFKKLDFNELQPDRVNCVFVSYDLETNYGAATNIQSRYKIYVKPYADSLMKMGARVYNVPSYGKVIALETPLKGAK